jgi:hypothetical protein
VNDNHETDDEGELEGETAAGLLAQLVGMDAADMSDLAADFAAPTHWPSLPGSGAKQAWDELLAWVDELRHRYGHLDHHLIPPCWWRHTGHVEALQALKDAERVNFSESSPGTAGVEWQRSLAFTESRLREWTGYFGCLAAHRPFHPPYPSPDPEEWASWTGADVEERLDREAARAV